MTWLTFSIFLDHAAGFFTLQRDIRSISIQNSSNIRKAEKRRSYIARGRLIPDTNTNANKKNKHKNKYKAATLDVEVKQRSEEEVNDLIKRRCFFVLLLVFSLCCEHQHFYPHYIEIVK